MDKLERANQHLIGIGYAKRTHTNLVLVAEALERNLEVKRTPSGRSIEIQHQGRSRYWKGGTTNHNSHLAKKIVHYKDVCNRHLRNHGVDAPENAVFGPTEITRAWQWAHPLGKLVVKPHNGIQGRNVHVGVETYEEFETAFNKVARGPGRILVEQFHAGIEHRCLVVDDEVVAVTARRPASIIGDGLATIEELVEAKNQDRGRIHKQLEFGPTELRVLSKSGYRPKSVPPDGERVYLRLTSNIHTGGDALDATDELAPEEREMIERAARSVPGLRIAGFDVLLRREDQEEEASASILEINANPMISMHHFPWEGTPRNVAGAVLDSMFPRSKAP